MLFCWWADQNGLRIYWYLESRFWDTKFLSSINIPVYSVNCQWSGFGMHFILTHTFKIRWCPHYIIIYHLFLLIHVSKDMTFILLMLTNSFWFFLPFHITKAQKMFSFVYYLSSWHSNYSHHYPKPISSWCLFFLQRILIKVAFQSFLLTQNPIIHWRMILKLLVLYWSQNFIDVFFSRAEKIWKVKKKLNVASIGLHQIIQMRMVYKSN